MKYATISIALMLSVVLPNVAAADCYADYKAKQDNPLRLHYGVAEINKCSKKAARAELETRLAKKGWKLLNIVSVFEADGLAERKESAGRNYLRY